MSELLYVWQKFIYIQALIPLQENLLAKYLFQFFM
jgi:hypothetical protein